MRLVSISWIIFFIGLSFETKSQYLDLSWPVGYHSNPRANLNFSSGSLVIDTITRNISLSDCMASISDSSGNIKALTNGCFINNSLNDTMSNGDNLNPGPCNSSYCGVGGIIAQGNMILPNPANLNQFILFHETCDYSNGGNPIALYTSIIDFTLDSGMGGVINKNNLQYSGPLCYGNLSAVKHANGRDWWVLLHKRFTDESLIYLLDTAGISGPIIQSIGPVFNTVGYGMSCFSPDGQWYCSTTQLGDIHLFNFNRCNGMLSNYQYVDIADSNGSNVAFSPNSNYMYIINTRYIYQYDVNNMSNNPFFVANYDGFLDTLGQPTLFGRPQLAVDGKIYIAVGGGTTFMHVINSPDSFGFAADVQQHSIQLPCYNLGTIPSLPNYRLGPLSQHVCDSLTEVEYIATKTSLELYPNPCIDLLKINLSSRLNKTTSLKIYNSMGQLSFTQMIAANEIEIHVDVSNFPSGVYFISIEGNQTVLRKSFVKM